jgi:phosphatidylglycerophosphatase A
MSTAKMIATVFGIGSLKPAPGTWGSLAALPAAFLIGRLFGSLGLMFFTCLVFVLGIWAAEHYEAETGEHDGSDIVIDEVAGQWISCIPLIYWGIDLWGWAVAFALFRLFDIWKPGPVGTLDKQFPGGLGTMIDDVAAGLLAALSLALLLLVTFP